MIKKLLGFASAFMFLNLASAQSPACEKLESLNKSCEEVSSSSEMQSPMKLYSAMLEELKKTEAASCSQAASAKSCAKRLNARIAGEKPQRPYYKMGVNTGLKNFGLDLMGAVTESPAPSGKSRAPANSR